MVAMRTLAALAVITLFDSIGVNSAPVPDFEGTCGGLSTNLHLENVKVLSADYLAKGTNLTLPEQVPSCALGGASYTIIGADLCRLVVNITTSPSSEMRAELWLPRNWTGRFFSGGNGGLTGCIGYTDLGLGSKFGFASISGNNGHDGNSGVPFYNAPEVLADYAYRAIHTQAEFGKKVVQTFYQQPPSYSYFMSCSGGGRQAMMSVQRFPEDFDGVISASPALDFPNFINWEDSLTVKSGLDPNSPDFLQPGHWDAVDKEALRQCDTIDGAADGIIEDSELCNPDFSTMICSSPADNTSTCLTGAQAAIAQSVFRPVYGLDGTEVYPALTPGTLAWAVPWYMTGKPHQYPEEWFKYVVYNDPNFDPATLTLKDYAVNAALDPYGISTFKGDISAFRDQGAKLIHIHGEQDGLITPGISTKYYQHVAQTMELPTSKLDEFYRYFKIGGLAHCYGGDGASSLGMFGETPFDPEKNILAKLVAWVEEGAAPEYIRGYKFGDILTGSIEIQRKHCKHPKRNFYTGPGPASDENAWECR